MDTDKWKSVLVPIEVYREIKDIAQKVAREINLQMNRSSSTVVRM